tara:strand:- start:439 stop:1305 length:867 start_codon:yes stop_codon:yes gene_type:complete
MRVTVLGSSGQIGAYLTKYLRDKGHDVREFDIVNGEDQDMTKIPNCDLHARISTSEFVFFLAFDVGGSHYLQKYQHTFKFIDNNTRMMANVFGYLEQYKVPFVFASSQMSNMSYSPYGVLKRVGELYTKSLSGLIVHFWNVYGIEKDMEKAHVITDFIRKGFESLNDEGVGAVQMMTDGQEARQFLYAEDCCEALETIMDNYDKFKTYDPLHITSFEYTTISKVAEIITKLFFNEEKIVTFLCGDSKDEVQKDKKNEADKFITSWWKPKVSINDGIKKVFEEMKNDWI